MDNAQRQRRYIERLKAKAQMAEADLSRDELELLMAYRSLPMARQKEIERFAAQLADQRRNAQ